MKTIGKTLLAWFLLVAASCAQQAKQAPDKTGRPNIIFILSDDHAFQAISAYASRLVQTPNIDRIALEGAIFRNALVGNSICGPSRATLLTGKYSHMNGYKMNEGKFDVSRSFSLVSCSRTITKPPGSANGTWAACPKDLTIGASYPDKGITITRTLLKKEEIPHAYLATLVTWSLIFPLIGWKNGIPPNPSSWW